MHYYQVLLIYIKGDIIESSIIVTFYTFNLVLNYLSLYFNQFIKESDSIVFDTTDHLEHFKPPSKEDTCKERLLVSGLGLKLRIMSLKCTQCLLKEAGMTHAF